MSDPTPEPINDQLSPKQGCASQRDSSQEISAQKAEWLDMVLQGININLNSGSWFQSVDNEVSHKTAPIHSNHSGFIDSWTLEVQIQILFQKRTDPKHSADSAPSLWVA